MEYQLVMKGHCENTATLMALSSSTEVQISMFFVTSVLNLCVRIMSQVLGSKPGIYGGHSKRNLSYSNLLHKD